MQGKKLTLTGLFVLMVMLTMSFTAFATTKMYSVSDPAPWQRVECWASDLTNMKNGQEPILKISLPTNDKVRGWLPSDIFVTDGYSSTYDDYDFGAYGHLKSNKYFLLGYGPNWQNATRTRPVLLVHGAADDINRAWTHPLVAQTPDTIENPGLMEYLSNQGFAVFAISFPHTQGNNLIQGQLIREAINVIKSRTGADKVDIVAHSKGNIASISYMSSMNNEYNNMNWLTDYQGDVGKYVAIAAPFKGVDTMFRYYTANTSVIDQNSNCPVAFEDAYIYYSYRDYHRWDMTDTYDKNYFQGQTQLLHNWVEDPDHPIYFNSESATGTDWNATRNALYYGGSSYYVSSEGIDQAIADPSSTSGTSYFIEKMNNRGINPYIDVHVLYGTKEAMTYMWWYPIGEKADDSDSVVFVASATHTSGIARRGADIVAKKGMYLNHVELTREPEAMQWIKDALTY